MQIANICTPTLYFKVFRMKRVRMIFFRIHTIQIPNITLSDVTFTKYWVTFQSKIYERSKSMFSRHQSSIRYIKVFISVHCREEGCIPRIWGGCKVVSRPLDNLCYWYLDFCDHRLSTQITEKQGKAMYKVQSNWGHCLCNLFYKKMLSQGMIFPENLLAGGVWNWKCDPCRLYLSISSWEYLEIFNALKSILSWYVMMRECEICSEVVSMYYIVWSKEAYQWFARQPATITRHLFAMRARSNAIVHWHRWLRDCDLEIVSRNMMHLDGSTLSPCDRFKTLVFLAPPFLRHPLVFRPQLHVGPNLLSEKKVRIIRGIFLVCCLQTSLTHSDTSRASRIVAGSTKYQCWHMLLKSTSPFRMACYVLAFRRAST